MQPFDYIRAQRQDEASSAVASVSAANVAQSQWPSQFIAGGTNMVDYMRLEVARPQQLIDISRLDPTRYGRIEAGPKGLRLGALVRMSQAEDHPDIRRDYPVIAQTLQLAASRQIRNMATLGGNTLQRTRCSYFREASWPCNKRSPGSGCSALEGENREHAVLGTSEHCIATYPGDFAQALIALDATLGIAGRKGARTLPFAELHRLPGSTPHLDHVLRPDEVITFIDVPAGEWTRRSRYVKIRDRDSYQFALTSAAVALHLDGETVVSCRIALGGVATIPWRAREAESALQGKALSEASAAAAAQAAFSDAKPHAHNAFKIQLGKRTLIRALLEARDMQV